MSIPVVTREIIFNLILILKSWLLYTLECAAGADPGFFLKGGGGVHLRSISKKGAVQEGV